MIFLLLGALIVLLVISIMEVVVGMSVEVAMKILAA